MAWGLIHAMYMIVGEMKEKLLGRFFAAPRESFSKRLRDIVLTFILVDFAWIFFVSRSFTHAWGIIKRMLSVPYTTGIKTIGLDRTDWIILIFAVAALFAVDCLRERGVSVFEFVGRQEIWFRWALSLGLLWGTIMLGIYGAAYDTSSFIYFQF